MTQLKTIEQRAINWLLSDDTGESSQSICAHMLNVPFEMQAPSDSSDLGRCLRLLSLAPEWAPRIGEMAQYGPAWAGLVAEWDSIVHLYNTENGGPGKNRVHSNETYRAMKLAIARGYRNDSRYECIFDKNGTLSSARLIDGDDSEEDGDD